MLISIQAVCAFLLCFSILLQHRASGLGNAFGGMGGNTYVQRRGAEKFLFNVSVVLSIVLLVLTVIDWYS